MSNPNFPNSANYVELDKTWSEKGSLEKSMWVPFGLTKESYCSSCNKGKSRNAAYFDSLTPVKENMMVDEDSGDYISLKQTWGRQGRYTT